MDQKIIILIVVICFICILSVSSIAGAGYIYTQTTETPKEEEETSIDETPTTTTPAPSTSTSTSTPSTSTPSTSTPSTSTPEPTTTPAPTTSTPTAATPTVDSTPAPFVPITNNLEGIAIKSVSAQKYLNVPGARKDNFYPIDIYECDDNNLCPNDKSHNPLARSNWTFTNNSEIRNRNSQKCLDIKGEIKDGAQVGQWDCHNGSNQKWIAYQDKTIRPKDNNKLCLDVIGNKQDNASPVGLFTCNNNDNQKWSLTKAWNSCVFWDQTNPATNKAGWCKKDINHDYFEKHIGRIGAGCPAGMGYGVCGM